MIEVIEVVVVVFAILSFSFLGTVVVLWLIGWYWEIREKRR